MSKDNIKKEDTKIFFPEGKVVKIKDREFRIMPYVLKENRKVIKIIIDNLQGLANVKGAFEQSNDLETINLLLDNCTEGLTDIYVITLKTDKEWIENTLTLHDEKNIWEAILEVNDFSFLLKKVKELASRGKRINQTARV